MLHLIHDIWYLGTALVFHRKDWEAACHLSYRLRNVMYGFFIVLRIWFWKKNVFSITTPCNWKKILGWKILFEEKIPFCNIQISLNHWCVSLRKNKFIEGCRFFSLYGYFLFVFAVILKYCAFNKCNRIMVKHKIWNYPAYNSLQISIWLPRFYFNWNVFYRIVNSWKKKYKRKYSLPMYYVCNMQYFSKKRKKTL